MVVSPRMTAHWLNEVGADVVKEQSLQPFSRDIILPRTEDKQDDARHPSEGIQQQDAFFDVRTCYPIKTEHVNLRQSCREFYKKSFSIIRILIYCVQNCVTDNDIQS